MRANVSNTNMVGPDQKRHRIVAEILHISSDTVAHPLWLELEQQCKPVFYLTWQWIGRWLRLYEIEGHLAVVRDTHTGQLLALGVLVPSDQRRHKGVLHSRQLTLHAVGQSGSDAIAIEHNGLLCIPGQEQEVWKALLDKLATRDDWDELIVPAACEKTTRALDTVCSAFSVCCDDVYPSYGVELSAIDNTESYLASLGKNTRAQVRRSIREYKSRGELRIERAENGVEAWDFIKEMAPLHKKRWTTQEGNSVFDNEQFLRFHKDMVLQEFSTGLIDVLRVCVAGKSIGWLYNYVQNNRVYFYLGALVYEDNPRVKPGLVTHALAIGKYAAEGRQYYDFLAGQAQYKASLGAPGLNIANVVVQRRRVKFSIENSLRHVKLQLFNKPAQMS